MFNKQKILKELAGLTLFELVRWLLVLVGGWVLSVFGANLLSSLQILAIYKPYLIAILVIASTWITLWYFQRFNRHRPLFPKLDSDFHILKKEISFVYKSPTEIVYKRKYKLKALKNSLGRFTDRYCWTGSKIPEMSCVDTDHQIDRSKAKDVYQFFDVIFGRDLGKGETIETEIIWKMEDVDHVAGSFISATIFEPTDELIMTVDLADCLGVKSVILEHSPDIGAKKHFKTSPETLVNHQFKWPVSSPSLMHVYRIRWQPHYNERP